MVYSLYGRTNVCTLTDRQADKSFSLDLKFGIWQLVAIQLFYMQYLALVTQDYVHSMIVLFFMWDICRMLFRSSRIRACSTSEVILTKQHHCTVSHCTFIFNVHVVPIQPAVSTSANIEHENIQLLPLSSGKYMLSSTCTYKRNQMHNAEKLAVYLVLVTNLANHFMYRSG